jgi:hypothetical protein
MFKAYTPDEIDNPNAVLYFAHAEKNQTVQVFGDTLDYDTYGITLTGALGETRFRIQPDTEYEFEFVVYDDLKLTLYIKKTTPTAITDPDNKENQKYVMLPSTVLGIYNKELTNKNTSHYGTTMKITLDTLSQSSLDKWVITNFKAFDVSNKKSTALFALNVEDIEDPITISIRANGSSAINNLLSDGYRAYIWDKQKPSIAVSDSELATGGWTEVPALSNSDGSKNYLASLFTYDINVIDRYNIQNRFGKNIFIMLATSGTTKMNSRYSGEQFDDIHSVLHVDYIKVESKNINLYHSNNKADVYVTTLNNTVNPITYVTTLNKQDTGTYFTMSIDNKCVMPVANIIAVTIGQTLQSSQVLGSSEYTIVPEDNLYTGSAQEKIRIILNNSNSNYITVQYNSYPDIQNIQNFFNSTTYGKIYGDILTRHKLPINLSFNIQYTGNTTPTQLSDSIKQYFDDNNDGVFVVRDFITYLYNQQLVNNVKEPITFSYTRYDDDNKLISGQFTDFIEARSIDFFKIVSLTVNKL